jgi:thiol:disulfide interchange protein DsbD
MVCDDTSCLPPTEVDLNFIVQGKASAIDNSENSEVNENTDIQKDAETKTTPTEEESRSLLGIFLVAFLFGFTALLTPCVFPMIPMTVSFFTKQSKTKAAGIRNAIIYGLSIIVIYVLLGILVSAVFGADALNALATNVWFNIIFFVLLIVFAISFLGAFEITLPSSWGTKVDAQADRGGIIGIFFMALALAIVSFSCTGPIVGTLLVEAASGGNKIGPIVGMLGFSMAIAIPFALFAAFPGWLNSLPKSGGWLNTVKVVLGFLELALAFKFLSNADLVLQLHWLEREVFLAIWIAVFGALAFYLFGKIRLPHDSPIEHISVGRLGLGLLVLTFTLYLIPGLWGAPLKIISGFPPPMKYSESPHGVGYTRSGLGTLKELPEGAEYGPHDIITFLDYEKGMAYAKEVNKPVLLDFTGHACANCRKMEGLVWSDTEVLKILNNDIVLVSLYVDEKERLPESEQYTSETTGKKIKSIGNKWSDF